MPDSIDSVNSEEQSLLDQLKQTDLFKNPEEEANKAFTPPEENKEASQQEKQEKTEKAFHDRAARRRDEKLNKLREENLLLNERLRILAEQRTNPNKDESDALKEVERIFGTVDEKGQYDPNRAQATETLKNALARMKEEAKQEAINEFESRQMSSVQEENEALEENEDYLDEALADVEESYGIDMESPKERNSYLDLLEEMSPKDREGNIIEYADPDAVARMYMKVRGSTTAQAKQIASRSMTQGGASGRQTVEEDATLRWLKENNLL